MNRGISFLRDEGNRALLGWLGGGVVAVIGALWTAFIYFHPASDAKPKVEASCGSVALGGDVSGATITAASSGDCPKTGR